MDRIRLAAEGDPVDPASLVPEAPIEKDAAMAEVRRYLASIQDADYRAAAEELLRRHERDFPLIPAAKSVHHSFRMGLLMHTGNMLKIADFLAGLYPEVIDRSLLLAGTFAHDLAKAREFQLSELGLATDYTAAGQLLGHLVMGAQEAAEVTKALGIPEEKGMLLQHLILSHHGEAGVRRGGAARLRRGGAPQLHRRHRQPDGDLPGGPGGDGGRPLQRADLRAGRAADVPARVRRSPGHGVSGPFVKF